MNGFTQQAGSMSEGMAKTVMNRFEPGRVLIYTELANEFANFDWWFTSVPASTQPNLFYAHSTTSFGAMSNMRKDLIHGFPQKTIFDSLEENGDLGSLNPTSTLAMPSFWLSLCTRSCSKQCFCFAKSIGSHGSRNKGENGEEHISEEAAHINCRSAYLVEDSSL
ncbi:hypothetical protein SLEP1_g43793 [Rubroshorea leprosula]|uniref:Uncharacterized protein n=1 Tax=Rubroshorea leprosula TaxID=152421 RepID=A0AAV5LEI0_9ROSI|nr:hypothetical protein SLEP1_g43793 [Rubroshorea leprosula]